MFIFLQTKGEYENESTEEPMADDEGRQYHKPSHLTNSFLHHDESPPIAQRFTDKRSHDNQQMPSEAT